jgi:hypothetical protein
MDRQLVRERILDDDLLARCERSVLARFLVVLLRSPLGTCPGARCQSPWCLLIRLRITVSDIHWHAVRAPGGMLRSVRDCTPICITPLRSDR